MSALPWRETADGLDLTVRLTPRSSGDRIEVVAGDGGDPWLKVRVTAPAVDGAANAALVRFLARVFAVPRAQVTLVSGHRGRTKRLHIRGTGLPGRLEAWLGSRG
jgi:uncharacterized protein (TIGR00251 family)